METCDALVPPTDEFNTLKQLIYRLKSIRVKLPPGFRRDVADQLDAMIASLESELGYSIED